MLKKLTEMYWMSTLCTEIHNSHTVNKYFNIYLEKPLCISQKKKLYK